MVSGQPALLDSRASAVWDDEDLYIAFWPQPHAGWAWNKHMIGDTHTAECSTYVHISDQYADDLP